MKRVAAGLGAAVALLAVVAVATTVAVRGLSRDDWLEANGRVIEIKYALEDYRADHGRYPSQEEGLRVLLHPPPQDRQGSRYFVKQYVLSEETLRDSWGRPIGYEVTEPPEQACVIYSLGRDGKPGGKGRDEDIRQVCHPWL